MKFTARWGVVLSLIFAAAGQAWADEDPALKALMDQTGLKYSWTDSGNAMVTVSLDGGRSQTVYVMKQTQILGGLTLRELWSNAGTLPDPSSSETLRNLLSEAGNEPVGAWILEKNDDGYLAYFSVKLPADVSGENLKSVIDSVAHTADTQEQNLSGQDEN